MKANGSENGDDAKVWFRFYFGYSDPPRLFARRKYFREQFKRKGQKGTSSGRAKLRGTCTERSLQRLQPRSGAFCYTHTRVLGHIYDIRLENRYSKLYMTDVTTAQVSFDQEGPFRV